MKRVLIVLLAALLVLAVGCKKQEAEVEEEIGQAGAISGGWAPAADYEITEARQAIFENGRTTKALVWGKPSSRRASRTWWA